ncbi:MAG: hypothetical protein JW821_17480 [Deltaproteobacteria bacterium]|nr:hypothetical protein [Deltaproteobacteria bacterium]
MVPFNNRHRIAVLFILALLPAWAGIAAAGNPLLDGFPVKGFEQDGPTAVYNRHNLFDYINGEAEIFLPHGFSLLYSYRFRCERSDTLLILDIYRLDAPEGAGAVFRGLTQAGGSRVDGVGDVAWSDGWVLLFTRGRHLVRIAPDPSGQSAAKPQAEDMKALGRGIAPLLD